MSYPSVFTFTITVPQTVIDDYGHVNNVVYLQWMQDAAIRHPESIVEYKLPENRGWFAREHRIEYLVPAFAGDEIEIRTWISEYKRVRAIRKYEFFRKADGKVIAKGETLWVFVELSTGKPIPIPQEMQALFPLLPDQPKSVAPVS
jgi:acyl-CoA thioester hydrolase